MRLIASAWSALIRAAPVRLWALILAGPPLTGFSAWLVAIVWRGPWPDRLAGQQLTILGYALFIALAVIAVIIIALASVKVKGQGPGGLNFEVDAADDDDVAPVVTTTTTTAVMPGATEAKG